jgi:hypothetical protein
VAAVAVELSLQRCIDVVEAHHELPVGSLIDVPFEELLDESGPLRLGVSVLGAFS